MNSDELSHKIIGCCMKVHNTLGCGFQEVIYQRALAIEFENKKLGFARELEMAIFYEGVEIGTRRVDFFVENAFLVELKAVSELNDLHLAQTRNYCEAYSLPYALLINFGNKSLQFKKVYNSKHPLNQVRKNLEENHNPKIPKS
jgi:GxxExxY protein